MISFLKLPNKKSSTIDDYRSRCGKKVVSDLLRLIITEKS